MSKNSQILIDLINIAQSPEPLQDITIAFNILRQIHSNFQFTSFEEETEFKSELQEMLLVKIRNVIQTTPYNNHDLQKYFGYDVPYVYNILNPLKQIGCRYDYKSFKVQCANSATYIDILNALNNIIFKNISDVDFIHLIHVADYEFISERKIAISSQNFAFIYHIEVLEQNVKLSFLRIQDGQQDIDMKYNPDPTKGSNKSYYMPFDHPFTIKIKGDDINMFNAIPHHNDKPKLLTNTVCHFEVSNKSYPVEIFYLSTQKFPKHLALRLSDKTIYVPISFVSFTFTKTSIGSGIRRTIRILGRERKIHKEGRKSYIIFKKQYMSLADARTLEKKHAGEVKKRTNEKKR